MLLLLFNIVPIWVVVFVFRATEAPLKTDIPTKFGTVLVIYGVLIPAVPLDLALSYDGIRFTDIFHSLIGNKDLLKIQDDPIKWFQFFAHYYLAVAVAASICSLIYYIFSRVWVWRGWKNLNGFRKWIMRRLDNLDIVDETQVLILQKEEPMAMDIFQGKYVYCGFADSLTGLFGTKSLTLKNVNRIHISKAKEGTPTKELLEKFGVPLKEVVFPLNKVVNYNIRRKENAFFPGQVSVEKLKEDIANPSVQ